MGGVSAVAWSRQHAHAAARRSRSRLDRGLDERAWPL